MRYLLILALLFVGCAKPKPLDEVRDAIERGDLERAAEILEPYAAQAATAEPPTWTPHATVRYTHPMPERIEAMTVAVKPQGYWWFTSVQARRLDTIPDTDKTSPRTLGLRGSWEGCAEVRGEAFNGLYEDDEGVTRRVRSGDSNVVTIGECLDPPPEPIPVPEPVGGWRVLGIVLCCITLAWIYRSRGKP